MLATPAMRLLLPLLPWLASCWSLPAIPAGGELLGRPVATDVDAEVARYYLAHPEPEGCAPELDGVPTFDDVIRRMHARYDARALDRHLLRELAEETGSVDFATMYFVRRLERDPATNAFQRAFEVEVENVHAAEARGETAPIPGAESYLFLLVPGWLWRSHPETGGDLQVPLESLRAHGFRVERIPTLDNVTVEENGELVAAFLAEPRFAGERIVLVSASKGSQEVHHALGALAPEFAERVRGWVSIGGLMQGSPVADWVDGPIVWPLYRLACLVVRFDPEGLRSMMTAPSIERFESLAVPEHVLVLPFIAVPLSGQVSSTLWIRYHRLRRYGPNDGQSLLADELIPGGFPVLELGTDHRFGSDGIETKTVALARVVVGTLEGRR